MRNHKILALLPFAVLTVAAQGAGHVNRDDVRCDAALFYIDKLISEKPGRPMVFSDSPEDTPSSTGSGYWLSKNLKQRVLKPPAPLLTNAGRDGGRSAIQFCQSIRDRLKAAKISFGADAVKSVVEIDQSNKFGYKYDIVGVTLPVVSASKNSAILYSSRTSGPLAAGLYIFYLKRDRSHHWRIVGSKVVSVA